MAGGHREAGDAICDGVSTFPRKPEGRTGAQECGAATANHDRLHPEKMSRRSSPEVCRGRLHRLFSRSTLAEALAGPQVAD